MNIDEIEKRLKEDRFEPDKLFIHQTALLNIAKRMQAENAILKKAVDCGCGLCLVRNGLSECPRLKEFGVNIDDNKA